MPAERLTMRKIREVFRLKFNCELSNRKIAKSCHIARSMVAEYLFRFHQASLSQPLPADMDDAQLEQLLYPTPAPFASVRPLSDCNYIHTELCKKDVTLSLLWKEYKEHLILQGAFPRCINCGTKRIIYHSCRKQRYPKCQQIPIERWIEALKHELRPVIYFHVIFTLPHELNNIWLNFLLFQIICAKVNTIFGFILIP